MKCILLHGLGQAASSWDGMIAHMNDSYDILSPDLSDLLGNKASRYSNLYQEVEKYCNSLNEPLNLCGLSLGGVLAMQYSIENPDKVNSLVLIGVQYIMPKKLLRFQNMVFSVLPNSFFQKLGFTKAGFLDLSKSMMNLDFQEDVKYIRCPTLILCGMKDKANKKASLQLQKRIPQAEISIIENAGHEVNVDTPLELSMELNAFLQKNGC